MGNPGFESRQRQCVPYLLQTVQTNSGKHPGSYSEGTEILSRRKTYQTVKFTTHLHLTPS
jgi:hypothetical protein